MGIQVRHSEPNISQRDGRIHHIIAEIRLLSPSELRCFFESLFERMDESVRGAVETLLHPEKEYSTEEIENVLSQFIRRRNDAEGELVRLLIQVLRRHGDT
jgi:hypothetical protein